MEIVVTVKNPTPEFEQDLLALFDKHRASLRNDPGWNADRARLFYGLCTPRAQRILREAVARDGKVDADDLRDNDGSSLRGHASSFRKVIKQGAVEGLWDSGLESPIVALGPGTGKVQGYQIRTSEALAAFRTALDDEII